MCACVCVHVCVHVCVCVCGGGGGGGVVTHATKAQVCGCTGRVLIHNRRGLEVHYILTNLM